MLSRAHVTVSGIVQGVYFRAHARDLARRLGVNGFIRNTDDGGVEAVFEGTIEGITKMLDFCRKGPPGSHVQHVDVSWEDFKGEFRSFEVLH